VSARRSILFVAAVALVAAACAGDDGGGAVDSADDATDDVEVLPDEAGEDDGGVADAPGSTDDTVGEVAVATTDLGEILVDGEGMSVYLFTPDEAGESTCYDDCAATWPPVPGPVSAGEGVDPGLLGTAPRTDGTVQATYAGWPLYLFAGDSAPGDVQGQGLNEVWWVIAPDGEMVTVMAVPRVGY
jgi:predicted lipoprotein with Yx(FWY)xxD motif